MPEFTIGGEEGDLTHSFFLPYGSLSLVSRELDAAGYEVRDFDVEYAQAPWDAEELYRIGLHDGSRYLSQVEIAGIRGGSPFIAVLKNMLLKKKDGQIECFNEYSWTEVHVTVSGIDEIDELSHIIKRAVVPSRYRYYHYEDHGRDGDYTIEEHWGDGQNRKRRRSIR